MLKKLWLAAIVAVTLAASAIPAAAGAWYEVDNRGNHLLYVYNDNPYYILYCRIRGSNGTWGNATIPPGYTYWFYIYGARNSYWYCSY